jgi:hypothetical protein
VNAKRVERIWRREGLKVPQRQPKRGRLWPNDGSCVRLRPQHRGHARSYDFVADRTHDGKAFRMLTVIDEHSRECLAIHVQRKRDTITLTAISTSARFSACERRRRRPLRPRLPCSSLSCTDETARSLSAVPSPSSWSKVMPHTLYVQRAITKAGSCHAYG